MHKLQSFDWGLLLLPVFLGIDVSQGINSPRLFPSVFFFFFGKNRMVGRPGKKAKQSLYLAAC